MCSCLGTSVKFFYEDDAFVALFLSTVYDCIVFVLLQWRNKNNKRRSLASSCTLTTGSRAVRCNSPTDY